MIGIVLVSDNEEEVNDLLAMIEVMIGLDSKVIVLPVGRSDSILGMSPLAILKTLSFLEETTDIWIFCDSESSQLSVRFALELLEDAEIQERITFLPELPLVEGAYVAAVEGAIGRDKAGIMKTLELLRRELEERDETN